MAYASIVILRLPLSKAADLDAFVEACLADGVKLIATYGPRAEEVEDEIDEIVVGDDSDDSRTMMTSAHSPDESMADVMTFCGEFVTSPTDEIEVVTL